LWSWRRRLRKQSVEAAPGVVPIRLAETAAALPTPAGSEQHGASVAPAASADEPASAPPAGYIDIELGEVRVRVSGAVDTAALRTVLTHLGRAR
jgi:hypothetical protein